MMLTTRPTQIAEAAIVEEITALRCADLVKNLGGKRIIDALSFDVARTEVVSLIGASGSGKTTLLRLIAGLEMPDGGEIALGGEIVWSKRRQVPPERRRIGMVFQDYALWPHMTVAGNLSFGLQSQGLSPTEITKRVDHALEVARLGTLRDRHPNQLSGGQQQRVAIARCLAARPALMLFDEPLSNLDAALREDLRVEMMDLVRREGITAVYVTHDQSEALAVSDRIAVMRAGCIAQFDTPQRLYERPANAFVASFIGGFSLLPGLVAGSHFLIDRLVNTSLRIAAGSDGTGLLVIRPEDARPAAAHPGNHLQGDVAACAFQGRCWRLMVALGPYRIRLDWPQNVAVGATIEFSLPPDRCIVLAG